MNIQNQLNENIFVFPHLNAACKKKVSERLGQPQAANGMREHNFYEYLKLARFGKKNTAHGRNINISQEYWNKYTRIKN